VKAVLVEGGVELRPKGYGKGREWSAEWRAAHKRSTSTPEFAEKSRQALLARLPSMRGPATNTPIEQRLQGALKCAGIGFTTQSLLLERYLVDIELRQAAVVIEADGAQHTLKIQRAKDAERDAALAQAGYRVFRFTGSEINSDADECVQRVVAACGLTPDENPVFDIRTRFAGSSHPRWVDRTKFICAHCGREFEKLACHRAGNKAFCNSQCYGGWLHDHPEVNPRRLKRDWSSLADLYAAGMSIKQLGAHFGCSNSAVRTAMRDLDIPVRPIGGRRVRGGFHQAGGIPEFQADRIFDAIS
jgi:very-short-patch-repair endonuclease